MESTERLRAWSHKRQRLGNPAADPAEALRSVVGVYSSHPTAPLALAARTRKMTADSFRQIDLQRAGVRIPAMRVSIFLVPRDNAARIFSALRQPDRVEKRITRTELTMQDYARISERVLAAATNPMTTRELQVPAGISRGILATVLRCLRYEGRLVSVGSASLRADALQYVATSAWMPVGLDSGDPAEALAWLADQYLRSYGPARIADFAWWAGVTRRAASQALSQHDTVDVGGGFLLPTDYESGFDRITPPGDSLDLLPKWDSYTMGYAPDGRARFVHPDVQDRVYTKAGDGSAGATTGDGNPVVLVNGQVVGVWRATLQEGTKTELFDSIGPSLRARLNEKLAEVTRLLAG